MLLSSSKRAFSSTSAATCLSSSMRLQQRLDHRRIAAHAVQADLDGQHVGIVRRLAQEIDHRLERIERMVQQDVLAADAARRVLVLAGTAPARPEWRAQTARPSNPGRSRLYSCISRLQGQRAADAIDLAERPPPGCSSGFQDVRRHILSHHQAHHVCRNAAAARPPRWFPAGPRLPVP